MRAARAHRLNASPGKGERIARDISVRLLCLGIYEIFIPTSVRQQKLPMKRHRRKPMRKRSAGSGVEGEKVVDFITAVEKPRMPSKAAGLKER